MTWPGPVSPEEPLARFLYSSGWCSRQKDMVKQAAFIPDRKKRLSVYRSDGMTKTELWNIGDRNPNERNLHGVGIVAVSEVGMVGLGLDPNDDHPRHADITGWPEDKEEQKILALQLSSSAKLVLRSSPAGGS